MKKNVLKSFLLGTACSALALAATAAQAATMKASPASPQPGDIITVTIYPAAGEKIEAVGMAAFDTPEMKFYARPDGAVRAFLGYPFDRTGGPFTLRARVQIAKNGRTTEKILSVPVRGSHRKFPTQHISMNSSTASTMSKKDALRKEKLFVQSKMKSTNGAPLFSGKWVNPTPGRSTSSYGRKRYVNGKWWGQHNGADIKAPTGARVLAANGGRVALSAYLPNLRGNCIVIDHGCNVFSIYMHLSQRLVREGEAVGKGQLIGKVGATGFVTGPHLHWKVRVGWEPVDPARVLSRGLNG